MEALPSNFKRKEAIKLGEMFSLRERSVDSFSENMFRQIFRTTRVWFLPEIIVCLLIYFTEVFYIYFVVILTINL